MSVLCQLVEHSDEYSLTQSSETPGLDLRCGEKYQHATGDVSGAVIAMYADGRWQESLIENSYRCRRGRTFRGLHPTRVYVEVIKMSEQLNKSLRN